MGTIAVMIHRWFPSLACAAALTALTSLPAQADVSAAGGLFTQSGNGQSSTGTAVLLSSGRSVPIVPVSIDATGFASLARGGGYALTLEGRFAAAGNAIGAGYGVAQFGGAHSGGTFTAFLDHTIAPLTSLELRGYRTTGASGATAAFLGLRFSL